MGIGFRALGQRARRRYHSWMHIFLLHFSLCHWLQHQMNKLRRDPHPTTFAAGRVGLQTRREVPCGSGSIHSPSALVGAGTRSPSSALASTSSRMARRAGPDIMAWGPLGPALPAAAFYIYFLPFVDPLDVDFGKFLQLIVLEGATIFALTLGATFYLRTQFEQLQQREPDGLAGAAASEVAGGVDYTKARLASLPFSQWLKLLLCVSIDLIGAASYAVGPSGHFIFAPLTAVALRTLFGGTVLAVLGFIEEAFPITDLLPTATLAWLLQSLVPDSAVTRFLGIRPFDADSSS
eukprot:CAMPEP_0178394646 /NCGR_PEP_ID=MMETSP0689_2-20121128/12814_1 /TAXON_ID=160604 /ORGANISM="Amphidinium massartii, Strain CS-259" /LENGTH=292 /DNA_ID=CAMNT_0020015283 /DNA_START=69 /DNA_END=944 /DNA_ORIENTATION=+